VRKPETPFPTLFVDVNKMVDLGSGSKLEVDDIMLTRYACYLIAQKEAKDFTARVTRKREATPISSLVSPELGRN
jgi:hypothetical protein